MRSISLTMMEGSICRKRSIDLVRQAQFAACSYLGFDPYEEKHKHGLAHRQVMLWRNFS